MVPRDERERSKNNMESYEGGMLYFILRVAHILQRKREKGEAGAMMNGSPRGNDTWRKSFPAPLFLLIPSVPLGRMSSRGGACEATRAMAKRGLIGVEGS